MASTAARGDHEATRLFEQHSDEILRFCLRQLGSRSEAEDALQLTFMHALRALRRGVVPESESAWLYAIAKNVCRGERRTSSRRSRLSSEVDVESLAGLPQEEDDAGLVAELKSALGSMPERQRRALVLREWHGVPPREIAAQLGMTAPAAHALLTRARHSFAQALTVARPALSLNLGVLVYQLRQQLKALFGGAAGKAAVAAVVVVGVGVGGAVVDRGLGTEPVSPQAPLPASEQWAADRDPGETSVRPVRPTQGRVQERVTRRSSAPTQAAAPVDRQTGPVQAFVPRTTPRGGEPASDPRGDGEATTKPAPTEEPTRTVPLDPLALPEIGLPLPTDLLPPIELPPLPPVLPVPEPELPPVELPPVELPPVPPPALPG